MRRCERKRQRQTRLTYQFNTTSANKHQQVQLIRCPGVVPTKEPPRSWRRAIGRRRWITSRQASIGSGLTTSRWALRQSWFRKIIEYISAARRRRRSTWWCRGISTRQRIETAKTIAMARAWRRPTWRARWITPRKGIEHISLMTARSWWRTTRRGWGV